MVLASNSDSTAVQAGCDSGRENDEAALTTLVKLSGNRLSIGLATIVQIFQYPIALDSAPVKL